MNISISSSTGNPGLSEHQFYSNEVIAFGKVIRKQTEGIVFNAGGLESIKNFEDKRWNRFIKITEGKFVHLFNYKSSVYSKAKAVDIQVGDYIFIAMRQGVLDLVAVYRP